MPRFAANLSWLYQEHPLPQRFAAAAADGFEAVELLFPYEHDALDLRRHLDDAHLACVLINAPCGNWAAGERGLAALPGRQDDFKRSIDRALRYAAALNTPRIHVMAGLRPPGADENLLWDTYQANLAWACDETAADDVMLLVEPINPTDMPGYLLTRQAEAHRLVGEIGAPQLRVQMDLYHCRVVEGEISAWLTGALRPTAGASVVGHMQVAGVPGRHEPEGGDIDYPAAFELIDQLGYTGWVGCEYRPCQAGPGGTTAGLGWARPWLPRPPAPHRAANAAG